MNTRNQSFKLLQKDLGRNQQAVFKQIKRLKKAALFEVTESLGWPINCVSGRITELKTQGKIKEVGTKFNPVTRRTVTVYEIAA